MPKTRLDRYAKPKAPPLDMAWATVLVRQKQLDLTLQDIASASGLSYEYTRKLFASGSPVGWPVETRDKVLAALGLKATLVIEPVEE